MPQPVYVLSSHHKLHPEYMPHAPSPVYPLHRQTLQSQIMQVLEGGSGSQQLEAVSAEAAQEGAGLT
jgi:hypothetical protein